MSENKNAKTPADGPTANRAMTLEEAQQWITTTWIKCQDEVWRQLPTPKKVSKDDVTPPKREWGIMDREDIIKLAREAGLAYGSDEKPLNSVTRFAALVAAHEREACARLCDQMFHDWCNQEFEDEDEAYKNKPDAEDCKKAIRERGNK
jgi:hypothetical protein